MVVCGVVASGGHSACYTLAVLFLVADAGVPQLALFFFANDIFCRRVSAFRSRAVVQVWKAVQKSPALVDYVAAVHGSTE